MPNLGCINFKKFLRKSGGKVRGTIFTDAKHRIFISDYQFSQDSDGSLQISRVDGNGNSVNVEPIIDLDESLIAFFGLYSGDGAKGSEAPNAPGVIKTSISFSQREPNLVLFALTQFRKIFGRNIHFVFSLGEDSAYFMAGHGYEMLKKYYGGTVPTTPPLSKIKKQMSKADERYLREKRSVKGTNEEHLAFYYFHKLAMEKLLKNVKNEDLIKSGIVLNAKDGVTASLRRPFKKGARELGGSSRSDEMHVGGLTGFGEFFLKILYDIEKTVTDDLRISNQELIQWTDKPSSLGETIDIKSFFLSHKYGALNGERPTFFDEPLALVGKWPRSKDIYLHPIINIDPLFCYVAGLYLAEGSTQKSKLFEMFRNPVSGLNLSFTSSEGDSIDLMLRSLSKIFKKDDCLNTWKIKVGSQYFPELVVIGLKHGVPMLRGGKSGDGKLRTMEISLAIKNWALNVAPALVPFKNKYSHVEPTGAGLARIDFSASSVLCRWYFPLIMYATFGSYKENPDRDFIYD